MKTDSTIITLLIVSFGWMLNEISQRFRAGSTKRVAIGRALAELLEIRHRIISLELILKQIKDIFKPSKEHSSQLGIILHEVLNRLDKDLPQRYTDAVNALSGDYPFLAYYLRNKDKIHNVTSIILNIAPISMEQNLSMLDEADKFMQSTGLQVIDESIRVLALSHGLRTRMKAEYFLRRKHELTPEYIDLLNKLKQLDPGGS